MWDSRAVLGLLVAWYSIEEAVGELNGTAALIAPAIEIKGVPQQEGENVVELVRAYGLLIGVGNVSDVKFAYRIPSKFPPWHIFAEVTSKMVRDEWIQKANYHREITSDYIKSNFEPLRIYVNEYLTPPTKRLLSETKKHVRKLGFQRIWSRDGIIFASNAEGDLKIRIACIEDLANFLKANDVKYGEYTVVE